MITTETIRIVCKWLGFQTCKEGVPGYCPFALGVDASRSQFLLGITDDTVDADGDLFGLALEVMAAVNARPGEVDRSRLQLTIGVEAASLGCYTQPPIQDLYYDLAHIDNANPASIATAIITLAHRRAIWEREQP